MSNCYLCGFSINHDFGCPKKSVTVQSAPEIITFKYMDGNVWRIDKIATGELIPS